LGNLWSPSGAEIPEEPKITDSHLSAVQKKLSGMLLKQFYLEGGKVSKSEFRKASVTGEEEIGGTSGISGASDLSRHLLSIISATKLSQLRTENFKVFKKLAPSSVLNYIIGDNLEPGCHPFSIVFLFDTKSQRDSIKDYLIQNQIYPAIFWDWPDELDLDDPSGRDFASRMLSIPCDFRYNADSLERVAVILEQGIALAT